MSDPYQVLGVSPTVSDEELRHTYRRLVQRYHPDHNGGSVEAAGKFEEVQEAYARVRELRKIAGPKTSIPPHEPATEDRLRDLERQVREAQIARDRAREAARKAAAAAEDRPERSSDEELGYVKTEDSFGKILSDAREELKAWLDEQRSRGQS